uniref:AAA_12 domain-containing protein n=1 Tax=Steinernema glaseri TaxID=37863 RepID=A0A1I7ZPX9_9BILA
MFGLKSFKKCESVRNQKRVAGEISCTTPLLEVDVSKLQQEINAKERLLKEVLRDIGGIPPEEKDRTVVNAVLNVTPGNFCHSTKFKNESRVTLEHKWTTCFEDMICVAVSISNRSLDNCTIDSNVFNRSGSVSSYQTIFDGVITNLSIPANSLRLVVVSFNKAAFHRAHIHIVFDCYFYSQSLDQSDNFFLAELRSVTTSVTNSFQRLMFSVEQPAERLTFSSLPKLFMTEIEQALQAMVAACPSRAMKIQSEDELVRHYEDIEKVSDFGSFALVTGRPNGLMTDICIYVLPSSLNSFGGPKKCILIASDTI